MSKSTVPTKNVWFASGLLLALALTASAALYCRAEWLETRRKLDRQRDLTEAAEISRAFWKRKFEVATSRRPLTARQKALLAKYEAAQAKKPLDTLSK